MMDLAKASYPTRALAALVTELEDEARRLRRFVLEQTGETDLGRAAARLKDLRRAAGIGVEPPGFEWSTREGTHGVFAPPLPPIEEPARCTQWFEVKEPFGKTVYRCELRFGHEGNCRA